MEFLIEKKKNNWVEADLVENGQNGNEPRVFFKFFECFAAIEKSREISLF